MEGYTFGLKNTSDTFQSLTDRLLQDHQQYSCGNIDDIAIFESWDQHVCHLVAVLSSIAEAGLTVNLRKCKFSQSEVRYLGHVIDSGKSEPDKSHVDVIGNMQQSTTKKELSRFHGNTIVHILRITVSWLGL